MTTQIEHFRDLEGPKPPPGNLSHSFSHYIRTWEADVEALIRQAVQRREPGKPFMVAICGIPGCGKSCSSELLQDSLNDLGCALLPADGYHYSRDHLLSQSNGTDLVWRRGAPDTFDAAALVRDLTEIRKGIEDCVWVPGFDHAVGDPTPSAHCYRRWQHKVVICEGLYLLHEGDGFESARDLFDLTIFVDADIEQCIERLKIRNRCIPGYTPAEIVRRVDLVDRVNALTVQRSARRADLTVLSATSLRQYAK